MSTATFTTAEVSWAVIAAVVLEAGVLAALAVVTERQAHIEIAPVEVPIAVRPVIDDLPLLKKGGKKVKYKLPEMWKKAKPVKRFEEKSAPTPFAAKTPEAIPTSAPQKIDDKKAPPPPDASVIKKADDDQPDTEAKPEPVISDREGAADGVDEGTEADPLKARAVSLYRLQLIRWFNSRFSVPPGTVPCEELKLLAARAVATVGGNRTVSGYSISGPSGNARFDALVDKALASTVGQTLPPPPDKYSDILTTSIPLSFSRKDQPCE